MFDESKGGEKL